ncbi:MAG: hypothetical protein MSL09_05205 [Spirochaetia bacterium]|nr:hypothetical protein [Spirochaetia bacterium]
MKKKLFVIVFLQCIIIPQLFSLTPQRVDIYLKNEFSTPLAVHCEFIHKEANAIPDFPERWTQNLMDRSVICGSYVDEGQTLYKSNSTVHLVWYTPNASIISQEFTDTLQLLAESPLEQKLKELFKTLVITDAEGQVLLTLEDFSKVQVEVGPNGRTYDIIIGEYLYQ